MSNKRAAKVRRVNASEVEHYRDNGWAYLPGFLDSDVASEMLKYLEERLGKDGTRADQPPGAKAILTESDRWRDLRFLAREEHIEPFDSLCFSEAMGENARLMMDRDIDVRYDVDGVLLKMPQGEFASGPTGWHQDFPNLSHDRVGYLVFWFALNDVPPERGSMRFLSGSQREGPLGRTLRSGLDLVTQYPSLNEKYEMSPPLDLRAGDATCHHGLVVHSAPPNSTTTPRWGYGVGYFPNDVCYTGAAFAHTDDLGLSIGSELDHPNFPLVWTSGSPVNVQMAAG